MEFYILSYHLISYYIFFLILFDNHYFAVLFFFAIFTGLLHALNMFCIFPVLFVYFLLNYRLALINFLFRKLGGSPCFILFSSRIFTCFLHLCVPFRKHNILPLTLLYNLASLFYALSLQVILSHYADVENLFLRNILLFISHGCKYCREISYNSPDNKYIVAKRRQETGRKKYKINLRFLQICQQCINKLLKAVINSLYIINTYHHC